MTNLPITPSLPLFFSLIAMFAFSCTHALCDSPFDSNLGQSQDLAPVLIAQYSSSEESTMTGAGTAVPGSPNPTTTSNSPAPEPTPNTTTSSYTPTNAPATSDETAKRAAREQLQHERDQQFLRLLLIGVFIFFAAIAFAGYLSIPRRKQESEAAEGTSSAD